MIILQFGQLLSCEIVLLSYFKDDGPPIIDSNRLVNDGVGAVMNWGSNLIARKHVLGLSNGQRKPEFGAFPQLSVIPHLAAVGFNQATTGVT